MTSAPSTATVPRPEPEAPQEKSGVLGLSAAQLFAGAGAAMTSAVVAGRVGVAGTLIGAALGSVVSTIAAAAYARSLDSARQGIKRVRTTVVPVQGAATSPTAVPDGSDAPLPDVDTRPRDGVRAGLGRALTVKTGVVMAVATFVVAMVAITVFEIGIGRPVSANSGGAGTSVGEIVGRSSTPATTPEPSVTPSSVPSESATPTGTATTSPSETVSPSGTATSSPTETETASPSGTATTSPSETASPSSSPSAEQSAPQDAVVPTP